MIFLPAENKKVFKLIDHHNFEDQHQDAVYTILSDENKAYIMETPNYTILHGKHKLKIEKNILKGFKPVAEFKVKKYVKPGNYEDIFCNKNLDVNFSISTFIKKELTVCSVRYENIFRGSFMYFVDEDKAYFEELILPSFQLNMKFYDNTLLEDALFKLFFEILVVK
ncbi:hypothetical protein COBT_000244 [Conglomerata obtusa]